MSSAGHDHSATKLPWDTDRMCWRFPIRWVFFLTQPVGVIEGMWSLLCDILQISAQLKHLFTFRDSMGWLPFCLFTVKKWCFMGLHVAPEVRWIETHFCIKFEFEFVGVFPAGRWPFLVIHQPFPVVTCPFEEVTGFQECSDSFTGVMFLLL